MNFGDTRETKYQNECMCVYTQNKYVHEHIRNAHVGPCVCVCMCAYSTTHTTHRVQFNLREAHMIWVRIARACTPPPSSTTANHSHAPTTSRAAAVRQWCRRHSVVAVPRSKATTLALAITRPPHARRSMRLRRWCFILFCPAFNFDSFSECCLALRSIVCCVLAS